MCYFVSTVGGFVSGVRLILLDMVDCTMSCIKVEIDQRRPSDEYSDCMDEDDDDQDEGELSCFRYSCHHWASTLYIPCNDQDHFRELSFMALVDFRIIATSVSGVRDD